MKITSSLLITINAIVVSIPTAVYAHPEHGASSVSNFMHQILYHAGEYYVWCLPFAVLLIGLSVRALINK